jgi:hypothetical protein
VRTLNHQPHEGHTEREESALLIAASVLDEFPGLTPGELRERCPGNRLAADVADAMAGLIAGAAR